MAAPGIQNVAADLLSSSRRAAIARAACEITGRQFRLAGGGTECCSGEPFDILSAEIAAEVLKGPCRIQRWVLKGYWYPRVTLLRQA